MHLYNLIAIWKLFHCLVPPPIITVSDPFTPYNGTVFTLTGVVQLDQSVDTDITVSGVWSSGDGPQETTSPPYPTNLTFQPLTTDSSGEYILTVTVRSSDNSPFIVENNSSATYNLVVQRKSLNLDAQFLKILALCSQRYLPVPPLSPWHHITSPLIRAVGKS